MFAKELGKQPHPELEAVTTNKDTQARADPNGFVFQPSPCIASRVFDLRILQFYECEYKSAATGEASTFLATTLGLAQGKKNKENLN